MDFPNDNNNSDVRTTCWWIAMGSRVRWHRPEADFLSQHNIARDFQLNLLLFCQLGNVCRNEIWNRIWMRRLYDVKSCFRVHQKSMAGLFESDSSMGTLGVCDEPVLLESSRLALYSPSHHWNVCGFLFYLAVSN